MSSVMVLHIVSSEMNVEEIHLDESWGKRNISTLVSHLDKMNESLFRISPPHLRWTCLFNHMCDIGHFSLNTRSNFQENMNNENIFS